MPSQLLTPFLAERDQSTRDVYNYLQVQVIKGVCLASSQAGAQGACSLSAHLVCTNVQCNAMSVLMLACRPTRAFRAATWIAT